MGRGRSDHLTGNSLSLGGRATYTRGLAVSLWSDVGMIHTCAWCWWEYSLSLGCPWSEKSLRSLIWPQSYWTNEGGNKLLWPVSLGTAQHNVQRSFAVYFLFTCSGSSHCLHVTISGWAHAVHSLPQSVLTIHNPSRKHPPTPTSLNTVWSCLLSNPHRTLYLTCSNQELHVYWKDIWLTLLGINIAKPVTNSVSDESKFIHGMSATDLHCGQKSLSLPG